MDGRGRCLRLTVGPASGSGSRTLTTSVNTAGLTAGTLMALSQSAQWRTPRTVTLMVTTFNASGLQLGTTYYSIATA